MFLEGGEQEYWWATLMPANPKSDMWLALNTYLMKYLQIPTEI